MSGAQRKEYERNQFRVRHYAGDVTYCVDGFLDKNNDLLFRDLKEAMGLSTNSIVSACFPKEVTNMKRPPTAGTQFKTSLNALIDILMKKTPSYVRCIKPNHNKSAAEFDDELVRHQVKYLGLMENLRVRRAGFAYRRPFEDFLQRYKCLCSDTWPSYRGSTRDGVQILMESLRLPRDHFRMGTTKIFIRYPKTLFAIEDKFQHQRHAIATKIQAKFKAHSGRKAFLAQKVAGEPLCFFLGTADCCAG